jgi:hypothetical protein
VTLLEQAFQFDVDEMIFALRRMRCGEVQQQSNIESFPRVAH